MRAKSLKQRCPALCKLKKTVVLFSFLLKKNVFLEKETFFHGKKLKKICFGN